MTENFAASAARSVGFQLGAGSTTVYTASNFGYTQIVDICIANITSGASTVTIEWFSHDTGLLYSIIRLGAIAANTTAHYNIDAFALGPLDEIRITPGAAATLHAIVTFVEVAGRSG